MVNRAGAPFSFTLCPIPFLQVTYQPPYRDCFFWG
jgi:hypothetical protein